MKCNFGNTEASLKDCLVVSYQYGIVLLKLFKFIHITQIPLAIIGALIIISLLLAFYYLIIAIQPRSPLIFIYITSPALWLLFERGNIGSFNFYLTLFATLTLSTKIKALGVFLIALSTVIKFYTLPILLVLPFILKNEIKKMFSAIVFVALVPIMFTNKSNIETFPFPMFIAFGSPVPGLW